MVGKKEAKYIVYRGVCPSEIATKKHQKPHEM